VCVYICAQEMPSSTCTLFKIICWTFVEVQQGELGFVCGTDVFLGRTRKVAPRRPEEVDQGEYTYYQEAPPHPYQVLSRQ